MTITLRAQLQCDGEACDAQHELKLEALTTDRLRERAERDGWTRRRAGDEWRDMCPCCSKAPQ